jgi:hypothetical protein
LPAHSSGPGSARFTHLARMRRTPRRCCMAAPPSHPALSTKRGRGDVSAAFTFGKNRVGSSCPRREGGGCPRSRPTGPACASRNSEEIDRTRIQTEPYLI